MPSGMVKWWDDARSFGVIARDDGGEDLPCHYSAVQADGCFRSLGHGQKVEFELADAPEGPVVTRVRRVFDAAGTLVTVLCGDAVQVRFQAWGKPNLARLAARLRTHGEVKEGGFLVRLRAPPIEVTFFDDGLALVKGTDDEAVARSLVERWLGIRLPE
jgi:CspA family cold shock protein